MNKPIGMMLLTTGVLLSLMIGEVSGCDHCRCRRRVVCTHCGDDRNSSGRTIVSKQSANRSLEDVEKVLNDMKDTRESSGSRELSSDYMQALKGRLTRLEQDLNVQPTETLSLGAVGGAALVDLGLESAVKILAALKANGGATDQDKAAALVKLMLTQFQQVQQSGLGQDNPATATATDSEEQFTKAIIAFNESIDTVIADRAKQAEVAETNRAGAEALKAAQTGALLKVAENINKLTGTTPAAP